jgi:hypothetical protein
MSAVNNVFTKAFEKISTTVEVKPEWANGTGYFDGVVNASVEGLVSPGDLAKAVDGLGRRIILINTRFGNVAVYDRFSSGDAAAREVFVTNAPMKETIRAFVFGSSVGEEEMIGILGAWSDLNDNVGFKIERMAKEFA